MRVYTSKFAQPRTGWPHCRGSKGGSLTDILHLQSLRTELFEERLFYYSDSLSSSSEKASTEKSRHLPQKQLKQNIKYFHLKCLSKQVRPLLKGQVYRLAADHPRPGVASPVGGPSHSILSPEYTGLTIVCERNIVFNLCCP